MKIIGITGKTGSGKSTAALYLNLRLQDSTMLDVDNFAKDIYKENKDVIEQLKICFGEDMINSCNNVNFKKLGRLVFSDCDEMKKLDSIMFPIIKEKLKQYIAKMNCGSKYLIIDAAILFNSGIYKYCNKIILVKSDLSKRRSRLIGKNRNLTEIDLENRLRKQKIKVIKNKVDFIIENNSTIDDLKKKLERIIKII